MIRRNLLAMFFAGLLIGALPATTVDAATTRSVKIAVIKIAFSNARTSAGSSAYIGRAMFGAGAFSAARFYAKASYGRLAITGKVYGTYTIADNNYGCTWDPSAADRNSINHWAKLARAQARAAGVNLGKYDKIVYAWARTSNCDFGGRAMPGGSEIFLNLIPSWWSPAISYYKSNWYVVTHEIGHSLGAQHAGTVSCKNSAGRRTALSGSCTVAGRDRETHDPFDIMLGYYNGLRYSQKMPSAFHRLLMGMLEEREVRRLAEPGVYEVKLNPVTYRSSVVKLIAITRPGLKPAWDAPNAATYPGLYLEWRRPHSFDNFSSTAPVTNGLTIRLGREVSGYWATPSRLIDTTPRSSGGWVDAPLMVGKTFTDAFSGVRITVLAKSINPTTPSASYLRVRIVIPAP